MRKLLAALMFLTFAGLLASCSDSAASVKKIKKDGVALIATVPFEGPLLYQKEQEMVGMDAELAKRVVARINQVNVGQNSPNEAKPFWVVRSYATIFPALEKEEAPLAIAVLGITEEAKEMVDFSESYYTSEQVLIINPVQNDIRVKQLGGAKIGVRNATAVHKLVEKQFASSKAVPFKTLDDAVLALKRGEIDAIIDDLYMAVFSLDTVPGVAHLEIVPGVVAKIDCAVAVRKGDEFLLGIVNEAIREAKAQSDFAQWISDQVGDRLAQVEARHGQRLERDRKAGEPRRVAIRVSKDENFDFDIYRLANLSFILTNRDTGQSYQSSRIDFQQRVGISQASVPPGPYVLSLPKYGLSAGVVIDTRDPREVTVNIRLKRGSIDVSKS